MYEEKPDLEYLAHYGVKGMKWGVRKDRRTGNGRRSASSKTSRRISKDGEVVELVVKSNKLGGKTYSIRSKDDKKVGSIFLDKITDKVANLDYVTIKPSERKKGYSKSALRMVVEDAKKSGYTKLIASTETVSDGPENHILKSMGFSNVGAKSGESTWLGNKTGYTDYNYYELDLTKKSSLSHTEEKPDLEYLAHYGVKGMKWGVRKAVKTFGRSRKNATARREANRKLKNKEKRARNDVRNASRNRHTLSEDELDARIKRLRKEKELRDLTVSDLDAGKDYAKGIIRKSSDKVAPVVVSGAGLYFVNAVISQNPSREKAERYITPTGKK